MMPAPACRRARRRQAGIVCLSIQPPNHIAIQLFNHQSQPSSSPQKRDLRSAPTSVPYQVKNYSVYRSAPKSGFHFVQQLICPDNSGFCLHADTSVRFTQQTISPKYRDLQLFQYTIHTRNSTCMCDYAYE